MSIKSNFDKNIENVNIYREKAYPRSEQRTAMTLHRIFIKFFNFIQSTKLTINVANLKYFDNF